MKSITKYPCELIEETKDTFLDKLWELSEKDREMGAALDSFGESLRNWIIQELYASSIVEEIDK